MPLLDLPVTSNRIGRFQYSDGNSHLLSAILTRATSTSVADFANGHLFSPLGLSPIISGPVTPQPDMAPNQSYWCHDPQGINIGGSQLWISAIDLLNIGLLILNNGVSNGKMIVSKAWLQQAVSPHVETSAAMPHYGYHWWIGAMSGYRAILALGYGGQHILILPELTLVTVITSDDRSLPPAGHNPMDLITRYVIPAIDE